MASWETLGAFALAVAVFAYMPGPATLYTAAQTLARGRRAGLLAVLGLHVGGYFHVIAVALGLSALLAYVPAAYTAIKLAGACYLVWLGISLLLSSGVAGRPPEAIGKSDRRAFLDSVLVEILNPKAALFFLAFLPQFADPSAALAVSVQLFILGFLTLLAFTSADLVTVVLASAIVERASNAQTVTRFLRRAGAIVLVGLGMKLALESDR